MADEPYIGQALPARIVRADGTTNLFRYAATYLGDARRWAQLAAYNGFDDPWAVPAGFELLIPPKPTSDLSGVPSG